MSKASLNRMETFTGLDYISTSGRGAAGVQPNYNKDTIIKSRTIFFCPHPATVTVTVHLHKILTRI